MSRRLLLLLAGFGGAAFAFVLWSGTAYASAPRTLDTPSIPGALGGALPHPGHGARPPLPKPAVPPAVRPVVKIVHPIVQHTITRVRESVAPVVSIAPIGHAPSARTPVVAPLAARTVATHPHHAVTRHLRQVNGTAPRATRARTTSSPARVPAHAVRHRRADRFPLGVDDGPFGSPSTGLGVPFAVTTRDGCRQPDGWSHAPIDTAREPETVVLRDIARPG
ncbi:MAG TPA: hypothetical protein VH914_19140 [Acidimicrobiia bacterium]|nr:hypothetical protein [Acidimicrobiia bacterium]